MLTFDCCSCSQSKRELTYSWIFVQLLIMRIHPIVGPHVHISIQQATEHGHAWMIVKRYTRWCRKNKNSHLRKHKEPTQNISAQRQTLNCKKCSESTNVQKNVKQVDPTLSNPWTMTQFQNENISTCLTQKWLSCSIRHCISEPRFRCNCRR